MKKTEKMQAEELLKSTSIKNILNNQWQVIGSDILEAVASCSFKKPKSKYEVEISASQVIETVLESDLLSYVHSQKDREVVQQFQKMTWEQKHLIAKQVFTFKTYGY